MNDMQRWKAYYEAEEEAGYRGYTDDQPRFRTCLKLVGRGFGSLLDAGCGEGHWLQYLSKRFPEAKYTGIEIAANRAAKAQDRLPGVRILRGEVAIIPFPSDSFDVVTCMEVLEHVPDWSAVLTELIRVAKKRVFLTVPYRQKVPYEICIHCHKPTPSAGHLHSFDESSFAEISSSYPVRFHRLVNTAPDLLHRLYYRLWRVYRWLAVTISI